MVLEGIEMEMCRIWRSRWGLAPASRDDPPKKLERLLVVMPGGKSPNDFCGQTNSVPYSPPTIQIPTLAGKEVADDLTIFFTDPGGFGFYIGVIPSQIICKEIPIREYFVDGLSQKPGFAANETNLFTIPFFEGTGGIIRIFGSSGKGAHSGEGRR
jgi:hypothetical protein